MSAYVDSHFTAYRRMIMCHMIADTIGELHAMAARLGLKRKWFQHTRFDALPHYDICKTKRAEALALGALEITSEALVARIRARRARPHGREIYAFERSGLEHPSLLPKPSHCPECDAKAWIRHQDSPPRYHCEACTWPLTFQP